MGHVVARHGGHGQDRDRARAVEVDRLFIARRQLAVEVTGITAVGRNLFHGDRDFLQRVGEVGHVGQQRQHPLAADGVLFGHRQRHVRHQHALDRGIAGGVDEHHGAGECARFIEGIAEKEVVVVLEAHAAKHDHVDFGLKRDARQQRIVGLARHRENRQLLRFDQSVEHVDHRNAGADHFARDDAFGRVDRGAADGDHFVVDRRPAVARHAAAVEDAPEQRLRGRYLHVTAEETDLVAGVDAARPGENLEINFAGIDADHLGQGYAARAGDFGQFVVGDIVGFDGDDRSGDLDDLVVYLKHV
ncbi:hypothetical protein SDC9_121725 [bioreactor metagenome]|uniref:Uncharacterized protein n=1 Tax=bioreactor metagenome TaxID=1076179 RepID=A0A645CCP3_9ZZZZ